MICTSYQPAYQRAADAGALTADAAGNPYLYRYGADVDQAFLVEPVRLHHRRRARRATRELLDEAIAAGYDGWMEDFGEYTPLDSVTGRRHRREPARTTPIRPITTAPHPTPSRPRTDP